MAEADLINESFENATNYDMSGWSNYANNNCVIDPNYATNPYHGSQCLRLYKPSGDAANDVNAFVSRNFGSNKSDSWLELRVKAISITGVYSYQAVWPSDGAWTPAYCFKANWNGSALRWYFGIYNNGGYTFYEAPTTANLDQWYKIGIRFNRSNNSWEWKIDDVSQNSGSLTGTVANGVYYYYMGCSTDNGTRAEELNFDYVQMSSTGWPSEGAGNNYINLTWTR